MKPHPISTENITTAFLTPAELSARWKVTTMTLRRWRRAGKLKTHHLGRGIRFSMAEIERIENEAVN